MNWGSRFLIGGVVFWFAILILGPTAALVVGAFENGFGTFWTAITGEDERNAFHDLETIRSWTLLQLEQSNDAESVLLTKG